MDQAADQIGILFPFLRLNRGIVALFATVFDLLGGMVVVKSKAFEDLVVKNVIEHKTPRSSNINITFSLPTI